MRRTVLCAVPGALEILGYPVPALEGRGYHLSSRKRDGILTDHEMRRIIKYEEGHVPQGSGRAFLDANSSAAQGRL